MGTGFTIDSPLKVARYGISSVVSLVDDVLIEQMRKYHSEKVGFPYQEISEREQDHRARRITAYLNLLGDLVAQQVTALQNESFETGSDLARYYEWLPGGVRKTTYLEMLRTTDPAQKAQLQTQLRQWATPGAIDVNIMTKVDRDAYRGTMKLAPEFSDALSALRGFAKSTLNSSVVFSAGLNARLYSYTAQFDEFHPDSAGRLNKKIVLKVSDFRSAAIQGRFLAKRGLWVSEFRIESGLNCGGHAFPTQGHLLGPILAEFQEKRKALSDELFEICTNALRQKGRETPSLMPSIRVTVQGGIGDAAEQNLLTTFYAVDGTGWGTPFLLVPEATNVDEIHLQKLASATERDISLSDHSPLGIPFWVLTHSASEDAREKRIDEGRPGTTCPKGFLAMNTEFTPVPICPASYAYQRLKLQQLEKAGLSESEKVAAGAEVTNKTCICNDLAGSATVKYGIDQNATTSVCCGPNIAYFDKIASLQDMISHIYGRLSLLRSGDRPHMFIRELMLYVDYLKRECLNRALSTRGREYLEEFKKNLVDGISYYRQLADHLEDERQRFLEDLVLLHARLESIRIPELSPSRAFPR